MTQKMAVVVPDTATQGGEVSQRADDDNKVVGHGCPGTVEVFL